MSNPIDTAITTEEEPVGRLSATSNSDEEEASSEKAVGAPGEEKFSTPTKAKPGGMGTC